MKSPCIFSSSEFSVPFSTLSVHGLILSLVTQIVFLVLSSLHFLSLSPDLFKFSSCTTSSNLSFSCLCTVVRGATSVTVTVLCHLKKKKKGFKLNSQACHVKLNVKNNICVCIYIHNIYLDWELLYVFARIQFMT